MTFDFVRYTRVSLGATVLDETLTILYGCYDEQVIKLSAPKNLEFMTKKKTILINHARFQKLYNSPHLNMKNAGNTWTFLNFERIYPKNAIEKDL